MRVKQGPFKGKKLTIASRCRISKYKARLDDLLDDLFKVEAFITDESQLRDFPIKEDTLQRLLDSYRVDAKPEDTLLSIAERIWG